LSENQYDAKFITATNRNIVMKPCAPPNASPTTSSRPLIRPRRRAVFNAFGMKLP